jgi:hypothetical protein
MIPLGKDWAGKEMAFKGEVHVTGISPTFHLKSIFGSFSMNLK